MKRGRLMKKKKELKHEKSLWEKYYKICQILHPEQVEALNAFIRGLAKTQIKIPKFKKPKEKFIKNLLHSNGLTFVKFAKQCGSNDIGLQNTAAGMRSSCRRGDKDCWFYEPMAKILGVPLKYLQTGLRTEEVNLDGIKLKIVVSDKKWTQMRMVIESSMSTRSYFEALPLNTQKEIVTLARRLSTII